MGGEAALNSDLQILSASISTPSPTIAIPLLGNSSTFGGSLLCPKATIIQPRDPFAVLQRLVYIGLLRERLHRDDDDLYRGLGLEPAAGTVESVG